MYPDSSIDEKECFDYICIANGKRTALMYAIQEGHLDIARYLIEHGADINLEDSKGMTIYDYLTGKAPYLGNIKRKISGQTLFYPPDKHENKNVRKEQSFEFMEFFENKQTRINKKPNN